MTGTDIFTIAVLLAVCGLFVLANYGERNQTARILTFVSGGLLAGTALLIGLAIAFVGSVSVQTRQASEAATSANPITLGLAVAAAGLLGLAYLSSAVRRAVGRLLPLPPESPVAFLSMEMAVLFLGQQLGTQLSSDVLSQVAAGAPLTNVSLLAQDLPLLALGFVGVGLGVRRPLGATLDRLGLRPPAARWWLIALAGIIVFILVGAIIDYIASIVSPGTVKRVANANETLFRAFNNPAAVLLLGVVAGVAEEIIFRGALQPRFGLLATAFLFAAVHTQYGITFASLEVFILGIGLGWMRLKSNSTVPSILTHAGYDITIGLIQWFSTPGHT